MNSITGRTEIVVGGEKRALACDMNAADVLFQKYGEHWTLWLLKRFVGQPVKLADGQVGRRLEALAPSDSISVLYALLATDREDRGVSDDEKALRKAVGLGGIADLQEKLTRCIIASFGVPGEAVEVVAGAAGRPRGSRRAATPGTGRKH